MVNLKTLYTLAIIQVLGRPRTEHAHAAVHEHAVLGRSVQGRRHGIWNALGAGLHAVLIDPGQHEHALHLDYGWPCT
jgi:hypothetical protein